MGFDIGSLIGGTIGDAFQKIMSVFKVDPTKAMENQAEITKIQLELQGKLQDAVSREIEAASSNIRAEAQSGDKYTSRARPTFLYIINLILAWNYVLVPIWHKDPINLPEPLFWLFGSVMLGYTGARTWEKYAGIKNNGDK